MLLRIFIVQGMPGRPEKTDQIYPGCLADVLLPGPKKKLTVLSSQLHVAILGRSCGTFEKGLQVKKTAVKICFLIFTDLSISSKVHTHHACWSIPKLRRCISNRASSSFNLQPMWPMWFERFNVHGSFQGMF
jgi:hypothetical protein